jgi:hypothetical protein
VAFLCTAGHVRAKPRARQLAKARFAGERVPTAFVCTSCGKPGVKVSSATREGIGFHYTTATAWQAIQKEGITPYPLARGALERKQFLEMIGGDIEGVYLWVQPFTGATHTASVIHASLGHRVWNITLLRVSYAIRDIIPLPAVPTHTGTFSSVDPGEGEPWIVHRDQPAVLLSRAVPPENIRLVGDYDLVALLART